MPSGSDPSPDPAADPPLTRPARLARVLLIAFGVLALLWPAPAFAQSTPPGVDAGDQLLLTKVRQAGLWEMPAGLWAETRGASPQVKAVGEALMVDHGRIDVLTRQLAAKLGVALPDEPSAEQQGWLNELQNAATPQDFDRIFANRLRAAHGQVFAIIASVRAGTRNPEIRNYATVANQAVLRHMTLLESTGLVDYSALPQSSGSTTAAPAGAALDLRTTDILTAAVVTLLLGGATTFGVRYVKSGRRLRPKSGESHG
jgi:predicted outer membrane protein